MLGILPPSSFHALEDVPDEIWRRIFNVLILLPPASPFTKHACRRLLLQVCRRWTSIILGTSELWQDLVIVPARSVSSLPPAPTRTVTQSTTRGDDRLSGFEQELRYSAQRPLTLVVYIPSSAGPALADVMDLVTPHYHRICSLTLRMDTCARTGDSRREGRVDPKSFAPWPTYSGIVNLSSLRHLHVQHTCFSDSNDLRLILYSCIQLESLEMKRVSIASMPDPLSTPSPDHQPIALPSLTDASLEMIIFQVFLYLHVQTPELDKLKLSNSSRVNWEPSGLDLGRLPSLVARVQSLSISTPPATGSDANVVILLTEAHKLKHLCLLGCGGAHLLDALAYDPLDPSADLLVPHLETLKLINAQVDDQSVLSFLDHRLPGAGGFPEWVLVDIEHCKKTTGRLSLELITRARGIWQP